MNADQLAEIRPALREVIAGAPDMCTTLVIEGDADKWIQVVDRTINATYPYSDNPQERIVKLGLPQVSAELVAWEAGRFATFELSRFQLNDVALWIDAYFVLVTGCTRGEYHLDVTIERI
jgi:aminopeptidase N